MNKTTNLLRVFGFFSYEKNKKFLSLIDKTFSFYYFNKLSLHLLMKSIEKKPYVVLRKHVFFFLPIKQLIVLSKHKHSIENAKKEKKKVSSHIFFIQITKKSKWMNTFKSGVLIVLNTQKTKIFY